mgnify:CR=1 FL=1
MEITQAQPEKVRTQVSPFVRYMRKNLPIFALMALGVIHIIMIQYMPMFGMVIAFKKYRFADGIFGSEWVVFFFSSRRRHTR